MPFTIWTKHYLLWCNCEDTYEECDGSIVFILKYKSETIGERLDRFFWMIWNEQNMDKDKIYKISRHD